MSANVFSSALSGLFRIIVRSFVKYGDYVCCFKLFDILVTDATVMLCMSVEDCQWL